jgi:hypothetical protein
MSRNWVRFADKVGKTNYYVGPASVKDHRCDEMIVSHCPGRSRRWRLVRHLVVAKRDELPCNKGAFPTIKRSQLRRCEHINKPVCSPCAEVHSSQGQIRLCRGFTRCHIPRNELLLLGCNAVHSGTSPPQIGTLHCLHLRGCRVNEIGNSKNQ